MFPTLWRGIRSSLQKGSQAALAKRNCQAYPQDKPTALTSFKAICLLGKTILADGQQWIQIPFLVCRTQMAGSWVQPWERIYCINLSIPECMGLKNFCETRNLNFICCNSLEARALEAAMESRRLTDKPKCTWQEAYAPLVRCTWKSSPQLPGADLFSTRNASYKQANGKEVNWLFQ